MEDVNRIRGSEYGLAVRSPTAPRLVGLTTPGPKAIPCSVAGPSPSCQKSAGAKWNWQSGASRPGRVRMKPPASAMFDVSGPVPSRCSCSTFSGVAAVMSDS